MLLRGTDTLRIYFDPTGKLNLFPNSDSLKLTGNVEVSDNLTVTDTIKGNTLSPRTGNTQTFTNDLSITGNATVNGNTYLGNAAGDTLFFQGSDTIVDVITMANVSGNLANKTVTMDTVFTTYVSNGTFTTASITVTLADDASYNLPNAKTVSFDIFVSGGDERAIGTIKADGVVTIGLSFGTITWDDADTDGDYCVYDGSTYGVLKNRSGGSKTFYLTLRYN